MIQFKSFKPYTHLVDGIRFPTNRKAPFVILYFSENSTLLDDYPALNIRSIDVKRVIVPRTKIPITYLQSELKALYKKLGLYVYSSTQKVPEGHNLYYDISGFLQAIDTTYKAKNYRQRSGFLIKNIISKIFSSYPNSYQKVLMYSVDLNTEFNKFVDRKIFPFVLDMKKGGDLYYDHLILNNISDGHSRYRLLVKDKQYNFSRVKKFISNVKAQNTESEEESKTKQVSNEILKRIEPDIDPKNKAVIKSSIKDYLLKDKNTLQKSVDNPIGDGQAKEIATAAILFKTSGNLQKSKITAKSIPVAKKSVGLKAIDKKYADELLKPQKTETTSDDIVVQEANVAKAVGQKSPEHIFEKRKIDYEVNLKKDITNSFKVLETKGIPLKVKSVRIVKKPNDPGEIDPSDVSTVQVTLVDQFKRNHVVNIDIPDIKDDGTFKINGSKKCLINQIVLCPISFPKKYDSKFESSYSAFHIWSKRTKREEYLEIYIGSYKLPLSILMSFSFGWSKTLKMFDLKVNETSEKPNKDIPFTAKIGDDKWLIFDNVNTKLKEEFVQSFVHADITKYNLNVDLNDKKYFNDLIIKISGRINSTYLIESNLENIVDPVAKQVLINKQLPSDLDMIMYYMASKVVEGHTQKRNDVSNQRIRNSEVMVHLAQKQILAAHTEFKEQVLSGNKKADFNFSQTKVLNDFVNTEIVTSMEYANPLEEMATKTRVTPVGKTIGGIPDKGAITNEGRNVHSSMYGNIDTLDTPEGGNVGINQQLTIDAFISSARGIIQSKEIKEGEDSGLLSTSSSQIPFIENNDGNRVMFGCNQARQGVPLINPEPPIIQSGYESILTSVLSDSFIKRAPCTGKITKLTDDEMVITCTNGKKQKIDMFPDHLKSGSGKDTLSVFKPTVKVGGTVKQNNIVAEGSCISGGSISMGRTLCVALMPYKGYNFEDGIVISERLVRENVLTSLHGIIEEIEVKKNDRIVEINKIGAKTKKGEVLIRKAIGDIEDLIGYEEEEEGTEIVSGHFIKKSPGGKIVDIEVFANVKESKFPEIADLILRTRKKYKLKPGQKFKIKGETIQGIHIKFIIEQELPINVGDKLTNRHGAKGIVSLVEKDELMPRTPTGDQVDIILNPIGVVGRMNVGQLYELYTGLIAKELSRKIAKMNSRPQIIALMSRVYSVMDMTKNKEFSRNLIAKFKALSATKWKQLMKQVQDKQGLTFIIPPFKAPAYKEILQALKILGLKAGYKLKLPEYNTKTKSDVPIGYMYMLKLEHIAKDKVHSRSTGPITSKTYQPTGGKQRDGGQRMGEADTYSFISYNCTNLLAEYFGPLSDDHVTKNEILADIITTGSAKYRPPKSSPVRDLLNSYFVGLMLSR